MINAERNSKRKRALPGMNQNKGIKLSNIKIQNQYQESKVFPLGLSKNYVPSQKMSRSPPITYRSHIVANS